jgi:hypothetical protein
MSCTSSEAERQMTNVRGYIRNAAKAQLAGLKKSHRRHQIQGEPPL